MLRVKELRLERGLSVPDLVKLSGVSRRTIQEMENRGDCRMSTAYKIAVALGVSLNDLWRSDPIKKEAED
jgi:DNA-binding XRE family transcriptional regulator